MYGSLDLLMSIKFGESLRSRSCCSEEEPSESESKSNFNKSANQPPPHYITRRHPINTTPSTITTDTPFLPELPGQNQQRKFIAHSLHFHQVTISQRITVINLEDSISTPLTTSKSTYLALCTEASTTQRTSSSCRGPPRYPQQPTHASISPEDTSILLNILFLLHLGWGQSG